MRTPDGIDLSDRAFGVLDDLDKARDAVKDAEIARNNLIEAAVDAGVPAAEVAAYFRISRQMVYRIAKNTVAANQKVQGR